MRQKKCFKYRTIQMIHHINWSLFTIFIWKCPKIQQILQKYGNIMLYQTPRYCPCRHIYIWWLATRLDNAAINKESLLILTPNTTNRHNYLLTNAEDKIVIMLDIFSVRIKKSIRIKLIWIEKFLGIVDNVEQIWQNCSSGWNFPFSIEQRNIFLSVVRQCQGSNAGHSQNLLNDRFCDWKVWPWKKLN